MGRLQDYYRLFDMFKGKLNEEQKSILEGLEDQLITEDILPAISESVAPVLANLRRSLTLVVDYDPAGGIVVKTTRSGVVFDEKSVKNYQIPASNKVVKVARSESESNVDVNAKVSIKRSPSTGLCVWISDDEFIQEKTGALTMVNAIKRAGVENVARLNIPHDGDKLVTKKQHPKYSNVQQSLHGGYLLNTHSSTETKKKQLERISSELNLGWKVNIIK